MRSRLGIAAAALALATIGARGGVQPRDARNALWTLVRYLCVPHKQLAGLDFPCESVNIAQGLDRGFAIVRAPPGSGHLILVPTRPISGLESPILQTAGVENYWEAAWAALTSLGVAKHARISHDMAGLVVNSELARSQDQFHIHIDCVDPRVRAALRRHANEITGSWAPVKFLVVGHRYIAMRVPQETLAGINPVVLLDRVPRALRGHLAQRTVAAVGVSSQDGKTGFVLMSDRVDRAYGDLGNGEEVLDRTCAVAKEP